MPAADRLWPHKQALPAIPREQLSGRAEQNTVDQAQARSTDLATKHRKFMTQNNDLDRVFGIWPRTDDQQFNEASDNPVKTRDDHPPIVSPTANSAPHRVFGTHRVAQQARNLFLASGGAPASSRYLIRDRDAKFAGAFDEVFRIEAIRIVRTPIRAPRANAHAERFVGTIRRGCLDWLLITNRRHLERVLRTYLEHYNTHRPHRALDLKAPAPLRVEQPRHPPPHKINPADLTQLVRTYLKDAFQAVSRVQKGLSATMRTRATFGSP
jgi:Integrase core domain